MKEFLNYVWRINNWQKGARLPLTPTEKIIKIDIVDKNEIYVTYENLTLKEANGINRTFNRKYMKVFSND